MRASSSSGPLIPKLADFRHHCISLNSWNYEIWWRPTVVLSESGYHLRYLTFPYCESPSEQIVFDCFPNLEGTATYTPESSLEP
jgi:hypothetical protein